MKGDGNCFYRSLYRAAKEHEDPTMLNKVFTILGADKTKIATEEAGQAALRAAVAGYYRTKFNTRFGPYDMLKSNHGTKQFKGWVHAATPNQAKIYKEIMTYATKKDGKSKFYSDLAAVIGTNKEYASDIDYMTISDILDSGGVKMVSSKHSPKGPIFNNKPALYIKRLSYDHYNYWRRIQAAAKPAPLAAKPLLPLPVKVRSPIKLANSSNSNSSANSNESTNVENEDKRQELLTKLDAQMDSHARCVEKCRKLKAGVDATKAELAKVGKK